MNAKRIFLGLTTLGLSGLIITSCNKAASNTAPTADTETATSVQAAWATLVATDIERICAFSTNNTKDQYYAHPLFYRAVPGTENFAAGTGTDLCTRDETSPNPNYVNGQWNLTQCMDGHMRSGGIFCFFDYSQLKVGTGAGYPYLQSSDPKCRYYSDFGYV